LIVLIDREEAWRSWKVEIVGPPPPVRYGRLDQAIGGVLPIFTRPVSVSRPNSPLFRVGFVELQPDEVSLLI